MVRAEQIRRTALAELTLAPYAEDAKKIATPDAAVAEFERWLDERPPEIDRNDEEAELMGLLGVRSR